MVHNSTFSTLKTLCVCVSLLQSFCNDSSHILDDSSHSLIRVIMRSSQSQVRVISQVTRFKSSHLGEISSQAKSSQVKSSQKLRLESESVTLLVTTLM